MNAYNILLDRICKEDFQGNKKTEIWARIQDIETKEEKETLIFWQDEQCIYHDETPNMPADLRSAIDNAWIDKRRIW